MNAAIGRVCCSGGTRGIDGGGIAGPLKAESRRRPATARRGNRIRLGWRIEFHLPFAEVAETRLVDAGRPDRPSVRSIHLLRASCIDARKNSLRIPEALELCERIQGVIVVEVVVD